MLESSLVNNVNFAYLVWESLRYDETQQFSRECQLHIAYYKNIVYTSINLQKSLKLMNSLRTFLGSK